MSKAVETLEIQIKASSKDLKSSINAAKREFSALDNQANISVSANTADAEAALKSVEKQTKELPDGDVDVTGDTSDAVGKLEAVEDQTKGLPDGDIDVTANTSEAEDNLSRLEEKGKSVVSVLKAAGLVTFGKKALDFAMESVDAASDAAETENKVNQLFWDSAAAREEIYRYTAGLHEEFGLNQTGLLDMTGSFAGAFKEAYGAEQAAEYAERLTNAAIDYASVLNKTPGEIGDIFMSMLKGNTAVADSAYIFGYTIESLNDTIAAMEQAGTDLPKGWGSLNDKQKQMYAMLLKVEENAQAQGFTGDFLRNKNSYAVQTTLLEEQWKTTEELAGKYLLPAKRKIVGGINDILKAVNDYAEGMGKSTFAKDTEGYFGNMELTEVDISNIVDIITAPVSQITDAVDGLKKKLGQAEQGLRTAYSDFAQALFRQEEGVGDAADTIAAAEKMGEAAIAKNEAKARSLGEAFVQFVDPDDPAWEEATTLALKAIDTYYDALNAKVDERTKALTEALKNGNTELARELANQQLEAAFNDSRYAVMAKQELALDAAMKSYDWKNEGLPNAESIERLVKAATAASAEERAQLEIDRDNLLVGLLEALYYQAETEGWSEEERAAEADSVKKAINDNYDAALAEMDARMQAQIWDMVYRDGIQVMEMAMAGELQGSRKIDDYFFGTAPNALYSFFKSIDKNYTPDAMSGEMKRLYDIYDQFWSMSTKEAGDWMHSFSDEDAMFGWLQDVFVNGLTVEEADEAWRGAEDLNDAASQVDDAAQALAGAVASIPERIRVLVNMHVGKYALGKAMNEAAGVYASIG